MNHLKLDNELPCSSLEKMIFPSPSNSQFPIAILQGAGFYAPLNAGMRSDLSLRRAYVYKYNIVSHMLVCDTNKAF